MTGERLPRVRGAELVDGGLYWTQQAGEWVLVEYWLDAGRIAQPWDEVGVALLPDAEFIGPLRPPEGV